MLSLVHTFSLALVLLVFANTNQGGGDEGQIG